MATNLPAIVVSVGGDLQKVVAEVENYTDVRYPLTRGAQMGLARIIERHPELNTEPRVALLVDILSWHGVDQLQELNEILEEYDLDHVYLAVDYLLEDGERTQLTARQKKQIRARVKSEIEREHPSESEERVRELVELEVAELWQSNSMETVRGLIEFILYYEERDRSFATAEELSAVIHEKGGLGRALKSIRHRQD